MSTTTTWPRPTRSALNPASPRKPALGGWELTTGRSALGWVAVVASPIGVRLLWLGDSPEALHAALASRFPDAEFRDAGRQTKKWAKSIVDYCEGKTAECVVPLDIQGTAFQQDVWRALAAIPRGTTSSYSEIAKQIGRPKAVRAVGTACGANPLAPIIPCHRVLRGDGGIGGYGYGLDRKRLLLEREGVTIVNRP